MTTFEEIKKILFLIFVLAMIEDVYAVFKVQIINQNSYDLIDYQVRIDITNLTQYLGTQLIQITDTNGNKLNFCYEQTNGGCNTTPSNIIWVKVPFIPAKGATYLVITKSDTNEATSGKDVFIFYEEIGRAHV